MAISEGLDGFVNDFGVGATVNATSGKVILDQPDQIIVNGDVISTGYTVTFRSSLFPSLKFDDAMTVDGTSYKVREVMKLDDGAFSKAVLSKV